jgi:hypothetical protein
LPTTPLLLSLLLPPAMAFDRAEAVSVPAVIARQEKIITTVFRRWVRRPRRRPFIGWLTITNSGGRVGGDLFRV